MAILKLALKNLLSHWVRSLLTILSLTMALLLLVILQSLVSTLNAASDAASARRLVVQSAVSLFVDLPLAYQPKIEAVDGVERTVKWQWFGGYYQDEANQFAQFATDGETLFDIYPEIEIVEGDREAYLGNRRGCLIGKELAERFEWEVGDTVPLIGGIFPHPDGYDVAWEYQVEAIYDSTAANFDAGTLFFHFDYFRETQEQSWGETPGTGTIVIELEDGADPTAVMTAVDSLFENGPQRVQTTPEDVFNAQFASMLGNIPFFLSAIGSAILLAILLACVNTMLMAGREQTRDVGVLKALGFSDGNMFALLSVQSVILCGLGGAMGLATAKFVEPILTPIVKAIFPGFAIDTTTLFTGIVITLAVGFLAGVTPAWRASRLQVVEAIRATA